MFTGLIEDVGRVAEVKSTSSGVRLRVRTPLAGELAPGESLAVNGVCLTVILAEAGDVHFDVGPETARTTTLGALGRDRPVNLERPMRADGRFGGHLVQGHVDGTGVLEEVRVEGDAHWLTIEYREDLAPFLIRRGSIAVDGISLTIAGLGERQFDVMIIPSTWRHTNLPALHPGDRVNVECDMVGKYVARALEVSAAKAGGTTR